MDRRDYEEPACPFEPPQLPVPPHGADGKTDLAPILARYDDLMARGEREAAGEVLTGALDSVRTAGDRYAELTILSELMGYYRQAGDPDRGIPAVEQGFALLDALGLGGTVTAGTILINGATALSACGRADRALRYYEEAFRCYGAKLAPSDLRFAALMNNMAAAYAETGNRERAISSYRGALKVLAQYPENPDAAVTHINLAQLYAGTDEDAAREELRQALKKLDAPEIVWDTYYAYTCRKCLPAFAAFGMDEAAREMEERVEIIHEHAGD